MKALVIAATAVRRLLRDRSNVFFVFLMPMMLILVLGAAFGGGFDSRVGVLANGTGPLGGDLAESIGGIDGIAVSRWEERADLVRAVERGRLEAAVIIPTGYDEDIRASGGVTVEFIARPGPSADALRTSIESLALTQGSLLRAAGLAVELTDATYSESLESAARHAAERPSLTVETVAVGEANPFAQLGQFELGAYSQLLVFVFLTSMTGSTALIESRRLGMSSRMLVTPTPVRVILLGEGLGRLGVALVQGLFIIAGSSIFFGVEWGDPLGVAALFLAFALGASGAAMLMGSVARNEEQAGGAGVLLGIGLGALGGAMVPLTVMEAFSPTLYRVAHVTPHAWAVQGFETLVMRGGGVADISVELAVLLAFALVMYTLGAWRLRVALTRP